MATAPKTELRYLGFICRARVGHFDVKTNELVDQETSMAEVPLITEKQFREAIASVKAECAERNAMQPNRAQRRAK